MESVSVRAIIIGVSIFIAIATMSAVMTYYNTAKEAVRNIGSGTDIAGLYEKNIEDILLKNTITGTEVLNVLNYFYDKSNVNIYLNNIKVFKNLDGNNPQFEMISGSGKNDANYKKIKEFIVQTERYNVVNNVASGITTITISG